MLSINPHDGLRHLRLIYRKVSIAKRMIFEIVIFMIRQKMGNQPTG